MADDEQEEILVITRSKRIGKEDKHKEPRNDQKEKRKKENYLPQQRGNILLHVPSLEDTIVGGEAPGQGDDRGEDRNHLSRLQDTIFILQKLKGQPFISFSQFE